MRDNCLGSLSCTGGEQDRHVIYLQRLVVLGRAIRTLLWTKSTLNGFRSGLPID